MRQIFTKNLDHWPADGYNEPLFCSFHFHAPVSGVIGPFTIAGPLIIGGGGRSEAPSIGPSTLQMKHKTD